MNTDDETFDSKQSSFKQDKSFFFPNTELALGITVAVTVIIVAAIFGYRRLQTPNLPSSNKANLKQKQKGKRSSINVDESQKNNNKQKQRNNRKDSRSSSSIGNFVHPWLTTTLKGHTGQVLDFAFSDNDKHFITCDDASRESGRHQQRYPVKMLTCHQTYDHSSSSVNEVLTRVRPKSRHRKGNQYRLPNAAIYHLLRRYTMTTAQMASHGYPLPVVGQPGRAYVPIIRNTLKKNKKKSLKLDGNGEKLVERLCCRCDTDFNLTKDGEYMTLDQCKYHWGRLNRSPPLYTCCSGVDGSEGCTLATLHVASDRPSHGCPNGLEDGYSSTRPCSNPPLDGNYGVCALDCEMCFTALGLEVARVTLVNLNGAVLYDALVQTESPVIDYNTRFSGLRQEDFDGIQKTLNDVHTDLLNLLNADTVLVGHGLENDLRALRLLHPTVADTAAVFPHSYGLPFRRSLRSLVSIHLGRTIQSSSATDGVSSSNFGHDSAEDARAALDLLLFRMSADLVQLPPQLLIPQPPPPQNSIRLPRHF